MSISLSKTLQGAFKERDFEGRVQIVCECLSRMSRHLPFESEALELSRDPDLVRFLILSSPYNWNSIQKILNALFFKLQHVSEFFVNVLHSIEFIMSIPEDKEKAKSHSSYFAIVAQLSPEIVENLGNIRLIAVEFCSKATTIVVQNGLMEGRKKEEGLYFDLTQLFLHILSHSNQEILIKKANVIFQDLQIYEKYFFTKNGFNDVAGLLQTAILGPSGGKSVMDRVRFKVSTLLRMQTGQKDKDVPSTKPERISAEKQKLELELGLASLKLTFSQNKPLEKLFLSRSLNVLINLQNFICIPHTNEVSDEFTKTCTQNKQIMELSKVLPCEETKIIPFLRAFLSLILVRTKGNIDFILKINSHFIEDFFDSIYKGLKSKHMSIHLAIWAIEFLMTKEPALVVSLIIRSNMLFKLLGNIHISKVHDFLATLLTPASFRMFNMSDEIYEKMWRYIKLSGLLTEALIKVTNPGEADLESKFDKAQLTSEIRECADEIKKCMVKMDRRNPYEKIIDANFFVGRENFNPFLSNEVFGIPNFIDFPPAFLQTHRRSSMLKRTSGSRSQNDLSDSMVLTKPLQKPRQKRPSFMQTSGFSKESVGPSSRSRPRESIGGSELPAQQWINCFLKGIEIMNTRGIERKGESVLGSDSSLDRHLSGTRSRGNRPGYSPSSRVTVPRPVMGLANQLFRAMGGGADGYLGQNTEFKPYPSYTLAPVNFSDNSSEFKRFFGPPDLRALIQAEGSAGLYARFLLTLVRDNLSHVSNRLGRNKGSDFLKLAFFSNLLENRNGLFFKVLYMFVVNTLEIAQKEKGLLDLQSVAQAAAAINCLLEFQTNNPMTRRGFPLLLAFIRENFNLLQDRLIKIIRLPNESQIKLSSGIVKEPFGELRTNLLRMFTLMSEVIFREPETHALFDLRLIQLAFISVFEHRNTATLAQLILRFFSAAFNSRCENFLIHVTLKLSLFNLVFDNFRAIYVNNTFIDNFQHSDVFFFISRFILLYKEHLFKEPRVFAVLIRDMEAVEAYRLLRDDPLFSSPFDVRPSSVVSTPKSAFRIH